MWYGPELKTFPPHAHIQFYHLKAIFCVAFPNHPPPTHHPACCKCKDCFMNDQILEFQFCLRIPDWPRTPGWSVSQSSWFVLIIYIGAIHQYTHLWTVQKVYFKFSSLVKLHHKFHICIVLAALLCKSACSISTSLDQWESDAKLITVLFKQWC